MANKEYKDLDPKVIPAGTELIPFQEAAGGAGSTKHFTRDNLIPSDAETKTAYEANTNTNAFTDADESKLDGIEASATIDQTGAEIKTAYEAEANAYTDTKDTKLSGIETLATADQSDAEIKTAYENNANTNEFSDAEQTKLANVIDTSTNTVTTTDATLTTIATIPITDNSVIILDIKVSARRTDAAARAGYVRRAIIFREGGGAATIQGTVDTSLTRESSAPWNANIAVSGNNVLIQVTGQASNTIDWKSFHQKYEVT